MAQLAGRARDEQQEPLPGIAPVAVSGAEGATVLAAPGAEAVAVAVLVVVELDAPLGMLAGRDSALVEASAVVVNRMSGAALKSGLEGGCPGPVLALSANHARSECSTWPGPNSGCRSMDNA